MDYLTYFKIPLKYSFVEISIKLYFHSQIDSFVKQKKFRKNSYLKDVNYSGFLKKNLPKGYLLLYFRNEKNIF